MIVRLLFRLSALVPLLVLIASVVLAVWVYFNAVIPLVDKVTPRDIAAEKRGAANHGRNRKEEAVGVLDLLEDEEALDADFFWMAQISDIHVSSFWDPARTTDLGLLCGSLLSSAGSVAPVAVILSGDLTDGKEPSFYGSTQQPEEWYRYKQVVRTCKDLTPTTTWLDILGNHDAFDVLDTNKLYLRNSVRSGEAVIGSYSETVKLPGGRTLSLVSVDATPKPGLKRPFNFFGSMPASDVAELEIMVNKTSDFTIAFGHYPTSVINAGSDQDPPRSLRDVLGAPSPGIYLCGHLHNLLGLGQKMYSRHHSGLLELELADWKDNRFFRVLAFDGDETFSFVDQKFHSEKANTAVAVLHPKDLLFMLETESLEAATKKKNVRVFVVGDRGVKTVEVKFDSEPESKYRKMTASETTAGIYTAPMNPSSFSQGLHTLTVRVTHSDGSQIVKESSFSLDGSHRPFKTFPSLILMAEWLPFLMGGFASIALAICTVLVCFRIAHHCKACSYNPRMRINKLLPWFYQWMFGVLRKLWILCSLNAFFWPLLLSVLYTCVGPWALARVMTSRHALIFVWGVVFLEDWAYMPPDVSFLYGIVSLLLYVTPLTIVLSNKVSQRYQVVFTPEPAPVRNRRRQEEPPSHDDEEEGGLCACRLCKFQWLVVPWRHLGILLVLALATFNAREMYYSYGVVCTLSPWGVGRIIFAFMLYRRAMKLEREDFYDVVDVWSPTP